MKFRTKTLINIGSKAFEPSVRFYAFVIFFGIVFLTGGGSRDDIQSLVLLRPLAILFCGYALIVMEPPHWRGRKFPLFIALALMLLLMLQLIPLPPSIWTELPERRIFADIANIAGLEQPWRPLSLSPSKTLNSLFSLAIPLAAMMLYLNLDKKHRQYVVPVFIVLCGISAMWALLQLAGPSRGPLYIYRISNFDNGVGLFANRNHQGVMLSAAIVMLGWYAAFLKPRAPLASLKFYGSVSTILVFVPLIFVTGSRAGLLLMIPGLSAALFFLYFGRYLSEKSSRGRRSHSHKKWSFASRHLVLLFGAAAIAVFVALPILFSRSLAYDRLFGASELTELRLQVLPILIAMAKDYLFWGSGFGSFEHIYKIYETRELLSPSYLNQAHNDWLQFVIEGGIPAIFIAFCAAIWFFIQISKLILNWKASQFGKYISLMCVFVVSILLAASAADYPLRVPSIIAIFSVMLCMFNDNVRAVQQGKISQRLQ
jgi:hypothetical protein